MGDMMLDVFKVGNVNRQSPEFDIPILDFDHQFNVLGGAGNVAMNIKSLSGRPITIGFNGFDEGHKRIVELFSDHKMVSDYIDTSRERITTEKIRFFDGTLPLLRMDKETKISLSSDELTILSKKLAKAIKKEPISFAILQDYNKGFFTVDSIGEICKQLKKHNIPFAVDPKKDNFWDWKAPTIFKPNLKEISEALGAEIKPNEQSLDKAANEIIKRNFAENILITLGENGIYYKNKMSSGIINGNRFDIKDVSGAGDTVIATAAMAYCCKYEIKDIAYLANLAAGLVCRKPFVQPIKSSELDFYLTKNDFL